jgi:hypothetical protein
MTTDATRRYTFHVGKDKSSTKETVSEERLKQAVAQLFPKTGANIQEQSGTWKGSVESGSWRIEHVDLSKEMTERRARQIRNELEAQFDQQLVLATVEEVETV